MTGTAGLELLGGKKGDKASGTLSRGHWVLAAQHNQAPLPERLCSARLGEEAPGDASQPAGLGAGSRSIPHRDLASCWVASPLCLSPFVSPRGNWGIAALTCWAGVLGMGQSSAGARQVNRHCWLFPCANGACSDTLPALHIPGDILLGYNHNFTAI